MGERIEVDRELAPLTMPDRLLNELMGHAREAYPEECCGLVLGQEAGRFESVHRCRNEMTKRHRQNPELYPRDGTKAFWMDEEEYYEIKNQAEERGLLVSAVYHSHINWGLYFSKLDQDYALNPLFPFPEACHIVISVMDGVAKESAAFVRCTQGAPNAFEGRLLEAEAPEAADAGAQAP